MANQEGFLMVGLAVLFGALTVLTLHGVLRSPAQLTLTVSPVQFNPKISAVDKDAEIDKNRKIDFANLRAKPNILLFVADDMGYEDLASYGHPNVPKNFIDELADTGIRYQSFYAADSLCTPARAGLLTGRLPIRTGIVGNPGDPRVFVPWSDGGLPLEEQTMPEMLKTVGYKTGMVGKWHIELRGKVSGINHKNATDGVYLPPNQGFDFVGLNVPLSNGWQCDESEYWSPDGPDPARCFLYNGSRIVQQPVNFTGLTDSLVREFDRFLDDRSDFEKISKNKNQPSKNDKEQFFFYFSFLQPHDALFSWKSGYDKKSGTDLYYGDILEMAEAMRQAIESLKRRSLYEDTLVIFMSDHGPHIELCTRGGRTSFKGGKSHSFEGGFRIPFILSWPSVVLPKATSRSVLSTLDLMATFGALTGANIEQNLDGQDRRGYLFNASSTLHHRPIFFYCNQMLMALRYGRYKFHFRTSEVPPEKVLELNCPNGLPLVDFFYNDAVVCTLNSTAAHDPPLVFDVLKDPQERYPLSYNLVPQKLKSEVNDMMKQHETSLNSDKREPQITPGDRALTPCCDPPKCACDYYGPFVPIQ